MADVCPFCGMAFGTCSHLNRFAPHHVQDPAPPEPELTEEKIAEKIAENLADLRQAASARKPGTAAQRKPDVAG